MAFRKNLVASNWRSLRPAQWVVLFLLLSVGALVRCHDLGAYPRRYDTKDEFHYLWAGLSLLRDGRPTAWSELNGYGQSGIKTHILRLPDGGQFSLVTPALDHPPLFSLAAGLFARLTGAASPLPGATLPSPPSAKTPQVWQVDFSVARLLAVILSAITLFLLFEITRHAFSFPTACLAALFYALTDHIVFHNRLLVTENLSTPLFLVNLLFLQGYVSGQRSRAAFAAVTISACAAALLCKVVAVSQAPAVLFLLVLDRKWRDLVFPIVGVLAGAALYMAYGWWQGWTLFTSVLASQAGRFYGFNAIVPLILRPCIVHTPNLSFVLLAGWIALFALAAFHRRARLLSAALAYLLAFSYFASVPAVYGWHVIPFYPFLCMALAALIARMYRRRRPSEAALLILLLTPALWPIRAALLISALAVLAIPLFARRGSRFAATRFSLVAQRLSILAPRLAIVAVTCLLLGQQAWSAWTHFPYRDRPQTSAVKR